MEKTKSLTQVILQTPQQDKIDPHAFKSTLELLETTINALYLTLPKGQKNYGDKKDSEIGYFSVEHNYDDNIELMLNLSEKSRCYLHGSVSREIAVLYVDSKSYCLSNSIMPKDITRRLVEDTQRVMEMLGFEEDDLRGCSGDDW